MLAAFTTLFAAKLAVKLGCSDTLSQLNIYSKSVYTVVWEKFNAKKFLSLVWHDENWTHEIF